MDKLTINTGKFTLTEKKKRNRKGTKLQLLKVRQIISGFAVQQNTIDILP